MTKTTEAKYQINFISGSNQQEKTIQPNSYSDPNASHSMAYEIESIVLIKNIKQKIIVNVFKKKQPNINQHTRATFNYTYMFFLCVIQYYAYDLMFSVMN